MGWFGLKSKSRNDDPEIRLQAVQGMTDQTRLAELARHDSDARVRAAAAGRIVASGTLRELLSTGDEAVRRIARERLSAMADDIVRARPLAEARPFLDAINDQKSMAELSLHAADPGVRALMLDRLLALPEIGEALLAMIAIQATDEAQAVRPVARIERRKTLKDVVAKAKTAGARNAAQARMQQVVEASTGRPTVDAARRERLAALDAALTRGLRLAVGAEAERAAAAWTGVQEAWDSAWNLHPWLEHSDAERERLTRLHRAHSDAQGHWNAHAASVAEAAQRAQTQARAQAQAEAASQSAQAQAAASIAAVVVPEALLALNAEAEALSQASGDRIDARHRYAILHKQWLSLAADLPFEHPERTRFGNAFAVFKQRGREQREARETRQAERHDALTALCHEAEAMAQTGVAPDADSAHQRANALKELQRRWRAVGAMPPARINALKQRFQAALDAAWAPLKEQQEAEDWARLANAAKADDAIAAVAATMTLEPPAALSALKRAQQDWKNAGALPRDRREALWSQWKSALDAAYGRLEPWFAAQDAERAANLQRRQALLDEAEALAARGPVGLAGSPADLAAKHAAGERFKAIHDEWKTIGHIPKEHMDAVWGRWRAVADTFFGRQREAYARRDQDQHENAQRKEALIASVEKLADDAARALAARTGLLTADDVRRRLDQAHHEWMAIGHVPMAQKEALWQRFRSAMSKAREVVEPRRAAAQAAGDSGTASAAPPADAAAALPNH